MSKIEVLQQLKTCKDASKIEALLDRLEINKSLRDRWKFLHKVMGVVGAFGGSGAEITPDKMDEIEYGLSCELLITRDWHTPDENIMPSAV